MRMYFYRSLIVFLLFSLPVFAQESPAVLTMRGAGHVAVPPDTASVSVGVEVKAPTADRALRLNSARMAEILSLLQDRGVKKNDIQTSQFALHPQWSDQSSSYNKPLVITGFVVTNVVDVRVRDLDRLGVVLDSLTKAGANRIQAVRFAITDPGPHLDQARNLAVAEARRKAVLVAKAAGVTLGRILSIDETGGAAPRPNMRAAAAFASDAVPIAEGELTLSAEVTIRFAIK
jgi:uncharacterized protein